MSRAEPAPPSVEAEYGKAWEGQDAAAQVAIDAVREHYTAAHPTLAWGAIESLVWAALNRSTRLLLEQDGAMARPGTDGEC